MTNILHGTVIYFFSWIDGPSGPRRPHSSGFRIILRLTTLGTTLLDERSVRPRDHYLTTHGTYDIHAPGGIGTHNPSKREAANPRLRPRMVVSSSSSSSSYHHHHHYCEQVGEAVVGGACGRKGGEETHRGIMGGNLQGETTATGRVLITQLKYQTNLSLNLVREFEVNTPRVVPHNSNCKFLTSLSELCFKNLGAPGTVYRV